MKIGFVGNTNNYPFALARAMLRLGHEVEFVVDSGQRLHRPEFRYFDIKQPYPTWIHDFSGVPDKYWKYLLPNASTKQVADVLSECDVLLVNGLWPILATRLGKPYVVILTGSDLEVYADEAAMLESQVEHLGNSSTWVRWLKRLVYLAIARKQRAAIKQANGFIAAIPGLIPNVTKLLKEIDPAGSHLFGLMVDLHDIKPAPQPNNPILRILNAARLTWKLPMRPGTCDLDYKGTDILIRGFSLYLAQPVAPMRLTLVRKGMDIPATEALVEQLDIGAHVDWMDEMSQSQLLEEYRRSDIISDQFASSIVSGAGLDAMAMGRPLLANGRPEIMEPFIGEPSPICQASTPEQVCEQLIRLADANYRERVGRESRAYVEKHHATERVAQRCLETLGIDS